MRNNRFSRRARSILGGTLVLRLLVFATSAQAAQEATAAEVPGGAPPLTLEQAQTLARRNNPSLRAARTSIQIPRAQLTQAFRFSNPALGFGVLPGINSGTGLSVSLGKRFEVAGQRGLRADAFRAQIGAAEWRAADVERLLRVDVAQKFYAILVSQELVQLMDSVAAVTGRLVEAADLKYRAGLAPELDRNIARIQLLQVQVQRAEILRELNVRTAELNALTGKPDEAHLTVVGSLIEESIPQEMSRDRLEAHATRSRPDAQAVALRGQAVSRKLDLARRLRVPDLILGLGLNREADGIKTVGLSAGFSLPLFDRNQIGRDLAKVDQGLTAAQAEATELAIRREVRSALSRLDAARTQLSTFQNEILALADASQRFAAAAYARGELDITTAVLAQRQFTDAQAGYLEAVLAFDEAAVELEGAVGTSLTAFATDDTEEEG
ncbi:MAG: TolC family protein [Gemmatimonadota bacterium]|nr:MAG: TolC family protein [Gemmatimonadota bacterium]